MTSPRFRSLLRKLFRWLGFGAIALITLIVLAYSILSFWGRREWAAAQAELREKGEKLSLVELAAPAIPDEENFFAIPLWREVLELEPAVERDGTPILKAKAYQHSRIGAFKKALSYGKDGPSMPSQLKGGYEKGQPRNLEAAAGLYRAAGLAPAGLPAPRTILAALDSAQPELRELQDAAARSGANLNLPSEGNYFRQPRPHISPPISIAQYLMVRIAAEAADGRGVEAKKNLFLLLRLADTLQSDPVLISLLVRLSILSIATQAVWDGLTAGCWNDAQLAEIQNRLGEVDLSRDFANALRGERGGTNQTLEAYARGGGMAQLVKDAILMTDFMEWPNEWEKALTLLVARLYPRGLLFQSLAIYNRLIQEIVEEAETEPFRLTFGEGVQRQIAELQGIPQRFLYLLVAQSAPYLTTAQIRVVNVETRLRQARIAVALERYRLANGEYPERLNDLVPSYFSELPLDVCGGENYRYRRPAPDQFILWSVGGNQTDDQGAPPENPTRLTEGDWIWKTALPSPK